MQDARKFRHYIIDPKLNDRLDLSFGGGVASEEHSETSNESITDESIYDTASSTNSNNYKHSTYL